MWETLHYTCSPSGVSQLCYYILFLLRAERWLAPRSAVYETPHGDTTPHRAAPAPPALPPALPLSPGGTRRGPGRPLPPRRLSSRAATALSTPPDTAQATWRPPTAFSIATATIGPARPHRPFLPAARPFRRHGPGGGIGVRGERLGGCWRARGGFLGIGGCLRWVEEVLLRQLRCESSRRWPEAPALGPPRSQWEPPLPAAHRQEGSSCTGQTKPRLHPVKILMSRMDCFTFVTI